MAVPDPVSVPVLLAESVVVLSPVGVAVLLADPVLVAAEVTLAVADALLLLEMTAPEGHDVQVLIPDRVGALVLEAVEDSDGKLLAVGVAVSAPVRVPLLEPEGVGVKEEKGELLGVESPEAEPVASRVVANGVGDPQGDALAVGSRDCDEEEERQRVAEKTRVELPETVAVGEAAVEADVLEEGEGALVMPGHTS